MRKNTLLLFFSFSFLFIFGLFLPSFISADDTTYSDCSNVSGYSLTQGQTCSINIKTPVVFNFKAIDPDGNNLTWSVDWGDKTFGLSFSCPSNLPNSKLSVNHSWASEGTYNVRLGVSNCKGGEAKASFNVIVIDSTPKPIINDFDLSIEKVGIWPTKASQGATITLNAKVLNLGNKNFDYVFYNSSWEVKKKNFSILKTNSKGTFDLSSSVNTNISLPNSFPIWDEPACGDNHYVFKVDAGNGIKEVSENNNEISGDVFVDCSKKPDFIIEKVGTWPTTVKSGSKPIFHLIERNIGEGSARAGIVRMTVNDQYEAGSWYYGSLSVGSSTGSILFGYQQFSSPPTDNDWWIPICSKGDKFTLKACADNACGWGSSEIEESNENNNILIHEVTCE